MPLANASTCEERPGPTSARRSAASLVACVTAGPADGAKGLARRTRGAGWLLIRADRAGDLSPSWLRSVRPWRLIFALRTRAQGGTADPFDPDRARRLAEAAATHDLVELEAPGDLSAEVVAAVPPARRLIRWRGPATGTPELSARIRGLIGTEAAAYQVVVIPRRATDGLAPLEVLHAAGRPDIVAYADGEAGLWSRVLAPLFGAPFVPGALDGEADPDPGEPTVSRLVDDFGLPDPGPVRMTFGLAGNPVAQSLSPRLHNASYRATGLPALFLPFPIADFVPFWGEMVTSGALDRLGLPLRGLTVASPNKAAAWSLAAAVSPSARRAGSSNLMYRRGDRWVAETTDPAGVLEALRRRGLAVAGRRAAVVGCGGSGRAIASALARAGAHVVLSNRDRNRGEQAARRLGLPLVGLDAFSAAEFDLIVNATPVGRGNSDLPFACGRFAEGAVVVDLVYAPRPTPLVVAASALGVEVIGGCEVLLIQASRQFAKMTGRAMPVEQVVGRLGLPGFPTAAAGPGSVMRQGRIGRRVIGGESP